MIEFLIIAFIVFLLFSKFYTIAKKKDAISGNDKQSVFVFTVFMFICTALWIAFKYAYKSTILVLICLIFWKDIKKVFGADNVNGDDRSPFRRPQ